MKRSISRILIGTAAAIAAVPAASYASTRTAMYSNGNLDVVAWCGFYGVTLFVLSIANLVARWSAVRMVCSLMLIPYVVLGGLLMIFPPLGLFMLGFCFIIYLLIREAAPAPSR